MKRFFSVLCILLLIFVFISCDNFSLIGKHSAKGTVYIQIPDSHAGRLVTLQKQEHVKDYNILIYKDKTDSLVYEKEFSSGELNSGIAIELNHGDYLINVVAYDSNGELFSGTNSEPVHVTSENTPENPAVVTINMKYVLVVYDNGQEDSSWCRHFETLEEDTVPSRLKPDPSFLPRKFFIRGKEINGWRDMDTSENYGVGEEIPLDDKTLPLHLTAVWGFPNTGYEATFADTKFYQISDVQWNYPLESEEPFGFTITGGKVIDYTCTGTEFLKLKNILGGSSITADIYLYTSEDDTEGTLKGTYTIDAVTKYGIKTGTPFLFTGEGLNHYNSLTADEASNFRMNSEKIICNPTNIGAVQTAIVQYLGGGQQGGNTLGITMVNVPGGTVTAAIGNGAFKDVTDENTITINAFQIGQTEVTYAQWCEVVNWATSDERGDKVYSFAFKGRPGNQGSDGAAVTEANGNIPVTNMSWRDTVVWCNAASEYQELTPAYYLPGTTEFTTGNVLRIAEDYNNNGNLSHNANVASGSGKAENAVVNPNANGYRLPENAEWEFAARGGDTTDSTNWNYLYAGSNTLNDVAVWNTNENAAVKSKDPNKLGLYDMSGNAAEWVWSNSTNKQWIREGSYKTTSTGLLQVDWQYSYSSTSYPSDGGFRVASGGAGNF